jgi:hypothetical protein
MKKLREGFNTPHSIWDEEKQLKMGKKKPPKLTVGARAITKHADRSSEGFWGSNKGTEDAKNENANLRAEIVLKDAVWVNIFALPHDQIAIECRVEQGYGIRWTIDGVFRGFLEPQMEGGHDKGWKH